MARGTKPTEAETSQQIAALKREVADLRRQLAAFYQAADRPPGSPLDGQETFSSEARYRALIELSPHVVWMTDALGNNTYCNKHWYDYTGLTLEQTRGEGWTAALHPDDLRAATEERRKAAAAGRDYEWEMRVRRASDGQYRWHLCRGFAVKDSSGKPLKRVGMAVDIHDSKTAATAIAEANERMLMAVDAAEAGTWDYYPKTGRIECSARCLEIFHSPPGLEPNSDHFWQVLHPKDRERVVGVLERAMDPAIAGEYRVDYRIIWPDGTVHWLLANGKGFFAGEGAAREAVRLTGIVLDITDWKEAERDRAALVAALQNSPDFIIITDLKGRLLFLNSAGREMVGLRDYEEARSKTAYDFLGPNEQAMVEREIIPQVRPGRVWEGEFCLRHFVSGEPIPVETRIFGIHDEDGRLTVLVNLSRDVSQKKKLEEQLRLAQKMEAVGRLAGGIAHDFNNLLTVIRGAAEVLQERWHESASLETINEISDAAQRASTLTEQLLAFGRRQMVRPRPVDLNQIILRAEAMLRRLVGEDIVVKTQLQENLWKVKMDPIQADQILINLAANARDAMPNGGSITIATGNHQLPQETEPTSLKPGHYVGLSFSDNGQGMDAETLSRIFEPFFTTKEAGNRSGLGLSTVYGIVHQCAGDISVRSTPGLGSCFTLYLPRITEDVSACEIEADTSLLQGSGNILLVEDEASLRMVVAGYLRERGYVVYEAGDAQEAFKVSENARVDLLLTDIVMPGTSGPELAVSLAPGHDAMRVIFMSGYAEHAALQQAILQPNALFIQKPFRLRTLLARIHEALREDDAAAPEQHQS